MNNELNLKETIKLAMEKKVEIVAPKFRKNTVSEEEIQKIIMNISINLGSEPALVLIGTYLLFLQGAANTGTPPTMGVEVGDGKYITKRNLLDACKSVTGNEFIRRIAETLAIPIGEYAEKNNLEGELSKKINNLVKATNNGQSLSMKEKAFCSSFSQNIPDLETLVSPRLAQLLAEDYKQRFENIKKKTPSENQINNNQTNKRKRRGN